MYKIKHIIAQNPNKLKGNRVIFSVEGTVYSFKIDEIRTTIMELTEYFPHEDIRNRIGPIEEELMGITYGKSKSQMEAWQYAKNIKKIVQRVSTIIHILMLSFRLRFRRGSTETR